MMHETNRPYPLDEMQEFNIQQIYDLIRKLSFLEFANITTPLAGLPTESFSLLGNQVKFVRHLAELAEYLNDEELVVSRGVVEKIIELISRQGSIQAVGQKYLELRTTLQIELSQKHFFRLSNTEKELFQPDSSKPLFGLAVQDNFPSALYEIDEAAKCLALERSTAVVFHLMRAMERTLIAIRKCLGLPDPTKLSERNWGVILRDLRLEVEHRNKLGASAWQSPDDQHFFSDIIGSVAAVKLAWRDTTMHVENKYLHEEAKQIFAAVRTLMQKVAARMDEEGMPLALANTRDSGLLH